MLAIPSPSSFLSFVLQVRLSVFKMSATNTKEEEVALKICVTLQCAMCYIIVFFYAMIQSIVLFFTFIFPSFLQIHEEETRRCSSAKENASDPEQIPLDEARRSYLIAVYWPGGCRKRPQKRSWIKRRA